MTHLWVLQSKPDNISLHLRLNLDQTYWHAKDNLDGQLRPTRQLSFNAMHMWVNLHIIVS